jgi:hypothetical protein
MAFTPPWAPHAGAAACFNRPAAIDMAATASAGDTSVSSQALMETLSLSMSIPRPSSPDRHQLVDASPGDRGNCHFRHALWSGPIISALTEGSKNWRKHNEENAW